MRTFILSALALTGASLVGANTASATWSCQGSEYICGSSKRSAGETLRGPRAAYKAPRTSKSAAYRGERRSSKVRRQARVERSGRTARAERRGYRSASRSYSAPIGGGQTGVASYYWQPQRVASGGYFNPNAMTAAHKTLPFGTRVRVTHMRTGRSVSVTINDRGPYIRGRVIDLSRAAAGVIGMQGSGVAPVRVEVVGRNS